MIKTIRTWIIPLVALVAMGMTFVGGGGKSHSDIIQGPFERPQDVTKRCLECHEDVADDFIHTRHWNWSGDAFDVPGHGLMKIGKINLINNYCIAFPSNYARCTSCHPGYGWKDGSFDFSNTENIDCLVCHEQTGKYKKTPTGAGMPAAGTDLLASAKSVGPTTKTNCGACHFNGGGGTGIKHGDMDSSLLSADKNLDVHMGGLGFECNACHTTVSHKISGASHGSMAEGVNHISCADCHDNDQKPIHKNAKITAHLDHVACETCHIPAFARKMPTKIYWDWSTAGMKENEKGADGLETYSKMKGDFKWASNVIPDYQWYSGSAAYYLPGDKLDDTSDVVLLNRLNGNLNDSKAKIYPFKVMEGRQIYDTENRYMIIPKLFGEGGYWKTYDWNAASQLGMKEVDLDYSGSFGFIETRMFWPINHMVAPKENALKCEDCHGPGANRLNWKALGYKGDPANYGGRKL